MIDFASAYPNSRKIVETRTASLRPAGLSCHSRFRCARSRSAAASRPFVCTTPAVRRATTCATACPSFASRGLRAPRGGSRRHAAPLRARGEITPEMEFIAAREGLPAEFVRSEVARGPRHHPVEHQSPRARADDHRPQLPGEDQRQHRQLRRVARRSRRKSRSCSWATLWGADTVMDLSTGQEHPRDARVDRPQLRRCRSAPCRSTRRSRRSAAGPRTSPGRSIATRSSSSASRASTTSPSTPACCCATSR